MITIVISTCRPAYLNSLKANIAATIGVPYEIIAIDNSHAEKGLCEIYNLGAKTAKYPILCYSHEDIIIKTENWGKKISALFEANPQLGLIGVAGSTYKPAIPTSWTFPTANHGKSACVNYIQHLKQGKHREYINPQNEVLTKVVAVDGLWFCTRKYVALELPFDEQTFKGFHCYDVSFALGLYKKYDAAVTYEVLIEHFSGGNFDRKWIDETFKLHRKWSELLPINLAGFNRAEQNYEEAKAFRYLLTTMQENNYLHRDFPKVLWSKKVRSVYKPRTFAKINLVLAKAIMKKFLRGKFA